MGQEGEPHVTMQTMKQAIRQRIIADRELLPVALRLKYSREITARLLKMPEYQAARTVLGYMSFGAEFSSDEWVQQVLADGKQLLLPKVNLQSKELDLYFVTDLHQDLALGLWDIREPQIERCTKADPRRDVDFILMPGVTFSRVGARLGYGGGFYDKLIARLPGHPALVAAAYELQILAHLPQEVTDRKVEWLLTENEKINCKPSGNVN